MFAGARGYGAALLGAAVAARQRFSNDRTIAAAGRPPQRSLWPPPRLGAQGGPASRRGRSGPRGAARCAARCDAGTSRAGRLWAKADEPEWSFPELSAALLDLPADERRAVLSLLGLAFGDAAGLPFELRRAIPARAQFHALRTEAERFELAKELLRSTCLARGRTPFVRAYTDDTSCCDLKMEAACVADGLLADGRSGNEAQRVLQLAVLQQYLRWAHGTKLRKGEGAHGELFQGTGGFTQDFLVPHYRGRQNEVATVLERRPLFGDHSEAGPFWPTSEFAGFARKYFRGDYSFASWGNGAVMSFAPHPILAGRWRRSAPALSGGLDLAAAAPVLSASHQEPTAALASDLLWELLDAIYAGSVASPQELRKLARSLRTTVQLETLEHECVPVAALQEWLERGDCELATAEAFLHRLTGSAVGADQLAAAPYGVFGALLHIAADWNDDHKAFLRRRGSKEPVLFSQRGLNSVIIALWAASGARSPWQALDRVIYVGGDTDTVGAVAGQLACPLMEPEEVVQAFIDFPGLGEPSDAALRVASAAARRYFRRALLFARGDLASLRRRRSLLDPAYAPLTGEFVQEDLLEGLV